MCPAVETIDEDVHLYAKDNFHLVDIPSNYYEDKVVAMHILRAASRNCDSSVSIFFFLVPSLHLLLKPPEHLFSSGLS